MGLSLRIRLSIMMFLQYFVWGAWGVVIFKFVGALPVEGGLDFPGSLQGGIGATLPIGAMISPLFIGLFADRFFATENVLAFLHLLGAGLLAWAAFTCSENLPRIHQAFQVAAGAEMVDGEPLAKAMSREQDLERNSAPSGEKTADQLVELQQKIKTSVKHVNETEEVAAVVTQAYKPLFWILLAYAACYMPTITLTNSLSFRNLGDPDRYFGGIRVLGTIGWIVAGLVVGLALNEISVQPLYLAAGASALLGLFCFALPHTPPTRESKGLGEALGLPALALLKERSFLIFFICSFLITIVLAFYFQQGNPFVSAIGTRYPAAVMTLGQVSEIFFMLMIPVGLRWLGTKGMLMVAILAWCLRYAIFATLSVPWVVAVGLPLHGVCYDFFFVVSYLFVDRRAPQHLRASAQGMITFITLGFGFLIGNLLAGWVVGIYTVGGVTAWTSVWLIPLNGALVAAILFELLFREPSQSETSVERWTKEGSEPAESSGTQVSPPLPG